MQNDDVRRLHYSLFCSFFSVHVEFARSFKLTCKASERIHKIINSFLLSSLFNSLCVCVCHSFFSFIAFTSRCSRVVHFCSLCIARSSASSTIVICSFSFIRLKGFTVVLDFIPLNRVGKCSFTSLTTSHSLLFQFVSLSLSRLAAAVLKTYFSHKVSLVNETIQCKRARVEWFGFSQSECKMHGTYLVFSERF